MSNVLFIIVYLFFTCAGLLLIKYGATNNVFSISNNFFNLKINIYLLIGLLFYVCSFALWVIILHKFKLSYIFPLISGISYVLIIMLSHFVLHEKITGFQWIGIVIIFFGVILMNIK